MWVVDFGFRELEPQSLGTICWSVSAHGDHIVAMLCVEIKAERGFSELEGFSGH